MEEKVIYNNAGKKSRADHAGVGRLCMMYSSRDFLRPRRRRAERLKEL